MQCRLPEHKLLIDIRFDSSHPDSIETAPAKGGLLSWLQASAVDAGQKQGLGIAAACGKKKEA